MTREEIEEQFKKLPLDEMIKLRISLREEIARIRDPMLGCPERRGYWASPTYCKTDDWLKAEHRAIRIQNDPFGKWSVIECICGKTTRVHVEDDGKRYRHDYEIVG